MGLFDWLRGRLAPRRAASAEGRRDEEHPSAPYRAPEAESPPDTSRRGEERDQLVMGVDIGTVLSKVVVSVRGQRVAVRFNAPDGEEDPYYLLPTALTVMDSGECRLGLHDGAKKHYDDIKKPLIDGKTDKRSVQLPLIAFMALLFQRVQEQIEESQGRLLSGRLDWLVNLGVPTESYGGGSRGVKDLVGAYRRSAEVAWGLAESMRAGGANGRLTIDQCRRAMEKGSEEGSNRIGVFPEFVPQVASYVQSKQRQEGVHVLVDAGGGTLDVTVFQVLPASIDNRKVPVWAKTVQPLGTRYLVDHIGEKSGRGLALPPFRHLPSEAEIAGKVGISLGDLTNIVGCFENKVLSAVGETIRDAGTAQPKLQWPGRMFLVGGGAFIEPYKNVAKTISGWKDDFKFRVRLLPLPRPDDLEAPGIDDSHWHRLAVAYGLSFDPLDIRGIRPPEDIPPVSTVPEKPPTVPPPWTGALLVDYSGPVTVTPSATRHHQEGKPSSVYAGHRTWQGSRHGGACRRSWCTAADGWSWACVACAGLIVRLDGRRASDSNTV